MWKTVLIFSNHHIILIIVTPTTRCDLLFPQYPCHCHQLVARYHQHDSKLGFFQPPSGGIQSGSLIWGNLSPLPSPRLRREWNFRSLPQSPVLPGHFLSARQNPLTILQSLLPHFSLFYPQFTIFYPKSIGNTSNSLILPEYNFFTLTPPFYKSPPYFSPGLSPFFPDSNLLPSSGSLTLTISFLTCCTSAPPLFTLIPQFYP